MSSSDVAAGPFDDLLRQTAAIRAALEDTALPAIDARVASDLLWTASLLYARLVMDGAKAIPAIPLDAAITPTEVVVTASGLLRAADLNSFDLAMWFSRSAS